MKGKINTKKKNTHHKMTKKAVPQEKPVKKMITEYYLLPQEISVSGLAELLPDYQEKTELWLEMDLMEMTLKNDALVFEEAGEDFDNPEDQAYLEDNGIQKVYAMTYDELDTEEVKKITETLQGSLGGRICREDEIL